MNGKETLVLLDLANEFQKEAKRLNEEAAEAIDQRPKLNLKSELYSQVANRLEMTLRKLNE